MKEIQSVKTSRGILNYYRDWGNEGGIVMENDQTIGRYREIQNQHPDTDECGVFFAFGNRQFDEGYKHLIELGHIKDGDKVVQGAGGLFGTRDGLNKFIHFFEDQEKVIAKECDPQEVYFYEYNNHESMIAWDGDLEAIKVIISLWGADVARKIKRFNASMSVDNIIRKPIKVEGLYFVHEGEKRQPGTVWFSNADDKGNCYCMYDCALHTVYAPNGVLYSNKELAGLNAYYNGKEVYNFYKE